MTDETKVQEPQVADKVQVTVAILVAVAGVVGYYLLANQPSWLRWVSVVASFAIGGLIAMFSRYGVEFRRFVELSRIELRKVVWPTRQEAGQTTLVVFVFVIIAGVFFWALDLVLAWATKLLTGQGS